MGHYNDLSLSEDRTTDDDWYDRKDYGRIVTPAPAVVSDLRIPRTADIIDRALDCRESAARMADSATVRQLDRLVANIPGAMLCWQLGTLRIVSPSGGRYRVSRAGCDCPNGQKCDKRQCWHISVFEILIDMLETDVVTADMAGDPPDEPSPLGDTEGDPEDPGEWRRPLGARLAAARSCYLYL